MYNRRSYVEKECLVASFGCRSAFRDRVYGVPSHASPVRHACPESDPDGADVLLDTLRKSRQRQCARIRRPGLLVDWRRIHGTERRRVPDDRDCSEHPGDNLLHALLLLLGQKPGPYPVNPGGDRHGRVLYHPVQLSRRPENPRIGVLRNTHPIPVAVIGKVRRPLHKTGIAIHLLHWLRIGIHKRFPVKPDDIQRATQHTPV